MRGAWAGLAASTGAGTWCGRARGRRVRVRRVPRRAARAASGRPDDGARRRRRRAQRGWNAIKASALGVPYGSPRGAPCWGAALVAGARSACRRPRRGGRARPPPGRAPLPGRGAHEVYAAPRSTRALADGAAGGWPRSRPRRQVPVSVLHVPLVGAGRAGAQPRLAPRRRPGQRVVGDRRQRPRRRACAGRSGTARRAYPSLEAALDCGASTPWSISTPTFTHRDLAVAAAQAGKHVFCEKPMALDDAECDAMIAAARRRRRGAPDRLHAPLPAGFRGGAPADRAGDIGEPMVIKSLTRGRACRRPGRGTWSARTACSPR